MADDDADFDDGRRRQERDEPDAPAKARQVRVALARIVAAVDAAGPFLPPRGCGRRDFILSPGLAEKYREYANAIGAAAPSDKLDAFATAARYIAGLIDPTDFPEVEAVDRLWETAEAAGLVVAHGEDAIQARLAAALASPIVVDEDHPQLSAGAPEQAPQPARGAKRRARKAAKFSDGGAGKAPPPRDGDHPEPAAGGDDDGLHLRLAFLPHTDVGNAERFSERNRGRLRFCPAIGWLAWDDKRWCREAAGRKGGLGRKVKAAAHVTARAIQDEAEALRKSDCDVEVAVRNKEPVMMSDQLASHGRKSEQAKALSAMVDQAEPYLHVSAKVLDADPYKFNVANGTVIIRKTDDGSDYISLRPHDPADLLTKCSDVAFDPKATCPTFDTFFAEVQPKQEMRRFLLQWQGLSLTGDVTEQKLCIFWGEGGNNGKSTLIDVCAHIAGEYSRTIPNESFLNDGPGRAAGQASLDLAMLPGIRHLRTSEPKRGAKLAGELIKLATGGEPLLARHLNEEFFEFYPEFKLTISGNYCPNIDGADGGIRRRAKLVPWLVKVADDRIDRHLGKKLRAEASGILNRLLDGLRDWLDHGLIFPADVVEATGDYFRNSDPCGRFIEQCTVPVPGSRVKSSEVHAVFGVWAKANAMEWSKPWSRKALAMALKEHGFKSMHSNGMWWLDVELTKGVGDFLDFDGKPFKGDSHNVKNVGGADDQNVGGEDDQFE